jgi:hypothetical protein
LQQSITTYGQNGCWCGHNAPVSEETGIPAQ